MKSLTVWALLLCGLVAVSLAQTVEDEVVADLEDAAEDTEISEDDDDAVSAELTKRSIKDGEFDANDLEDDDFEDNDDFSDELMADSEFDDDMEEDESFDDDMFENGDIADEETEMADQMKMMGIPFRKAYKILGANQICFAIKQLKPSIRKRVVLRILKKKVMKKKMPMRRRKGMKTYMKMKMQRRRRPSCRPRCSCRTPTICKRRGYKKQPSMRYWRYKRLRSYLMRMILQGRLTAMPMPY